MSKGGNRRRRRMQAQQQKAQSKPAQTESNSQKPVATTQATEQTEITPRGKPTVDRPISNPKTEAARNNSGETPTERYARNLTYWTACLVGVGVLTAIVLFLQ